ncbi:hypothetical protein GDO78_016946 [Eleutherodactylus coqui]|uniref:Uncharacterized protein n=1 Tax=Eleutherodactylus coqui TaxID=57060 RepID=A0A8J6EBV1_ELECQ|nr:hypothetical protein GDO78_016946 [Eleutherodactylus coqui]
MWETSLREVMGSVRRSRTSSANKLILCCLSPAGIPLMFAFNLIASARGSIIRVKSKGDNGHPCRVPFVILKGFEKVPSTRTPAEGSP